MTTVAVCGTGTMGAGMARSLLRGEFDVRAWNRSPDKAAPLEFDGAVVCDSAAEALQGADLVVLMLFDADAVIDTLEQAATAITPTTVVLQCSTIGPDGMARVAALAAARGWQVLDCPVLGTRQPAEQGNLVVLASGSPELRGRAQPLFDAIGSRTVWAGDELGQASSLKLACNSWVATLTAAAGQALALARGAGLDPQLVLEAIRGGASDSAYLQAKGQAMIAGDYAVSFALDGVRKDLDLMSATAATAGVNPALLDSLRAVFASASEQGHGGDDMAAVVTAFAPADHR